MNGDPRNVFNNPYALSFNKANQPPSRKQTFPISGNQNRENSNLAYFAQQRPFKNSNVRGNESRNMYEKSRVSNHSEESYNLGLMLNDGDIFPQDLLFLLSDEEKNISSFKEKIEREKSKLENDFSNFKREIEHIIEDLKISLHAELDIVYKLFIEKYANLKSEVQEIRKIRKQVETSYVSEHTSNFGLNSNKQLVKELERDSENYKRFRIHNYIAQLQKKKLNPILDLSKQLILMGTTSNPYYNADSTLKQLTQLKSNFSHFTKHMFSALGQYVRSPNLMFEQNMVLDDLQSDGGEYGRREQDFQIPIKYPKNMPPKDTIETPKYNIHYENIPPKNYQSFQPLPPQFQNYSLRPQKKVSISQSQQIICSDFVQDINIKLLNNLKPEHSNIILCATIIDGKYVATGSKDATIYIQTFEGYKVATLRGHESSICTLAVIQDQSNIYLASGSDVGCSSVILWDIYNWNIKCKIQAHTAAVTSIVDLADGQTIVSGSYDKKINVYNYKKSSVLYNLLNNKSSVTAIITNSNKSKLMSCGLDSTLYVWGIIKRKDNGIVQSINLQRVIQNNSMICSLNCSFMRNQIAITGTKDGKIKFFNIATGETEKVFTANNSAIIQLIVIQRQTKSNFPIILSCSSKDKALVMTRTDTGVNSFFDVSDKLNIQFGCGIGPKIVFDKFKSNTVMGIVSQIAQRKQFNIFQLQLK